MVIKLLLPPVMKPLKWGQARLFNHDFITGHWCDSVESGRCANQLFLFGIQLITSTQISTVLFYFQVHNSWGSWGVGREKEEEIMKKNIN